MMYDAPSIQVDENGVPKAGSEKMIRELQLEMEAFQALSPYMDHLIKVGRLEDADMVIRGNHHPAGQEELALIGMKLGIRFYVHQCLQEGMFRTSHGCGSKDSLRLSMFRSGDTAAANEHYDYMVEASQTDDFKDAACGIKKLQTAPSKTADSHNEFFLDKQLDSHLADCEDVAKSLRAELQFGMHLRISEIQEQRNSQSKSTEDCPVISLDAATAMDATISPKPSDAATAVDATSSPRPSNAGVAGTSSDALAATTVDATISPKPSDAATAVDATSSPRPSDAGVAGTSSDALAATALDATSSPRPSDAGVAISMDAASCSLPSVDFNGSKDAANCSDTVPSVVDAACSTTPTKTSSAGPSGDGATSMDDEDLQDKH